MLPAMATARLLGRGQGWRAYDVICTAGPGDRPFEEQHANATITLVTCGSFHYRGSAGAALLVPGALLLGNRGACYRCGHEHGRGDRCLSLQFDPAPLEDAVAAVPGARRAVFDRACLPPSHALAPLLAAVEAAVVEGAAAEGATAQAATGHGDAAGLDELVWRLVLAVIGLLAEAPAAGRPPSAGDLRRVAEAARRIAAVPDEPARLGDLAAAAGVSPYHFLRMFSRVVGLTPHQYRLRCRLGRAALRLRDSGEPVSAIAFDAGFGDLSTFNRRFKRVTGQTPGAYRGRRAAS
ncbi:MAG: AraC family transcriptional regulator [Thalassobaculales bacterium]